MQTALNNKTLWQTLLSDYPYKHRNRMELDRIAEQINTLAIRISGDLDYTTVVDFLLKLISDVTLPNSIQGNLEFDLFMYRYFWWAEHELKDKGIMPPPTEELNRIADYFKRLS